MSQTDGNLGLYARGPLSWTQKEDGECVYDTDANAQKVDGAITEIKNTIETIVITGLPPIIDGGTF